jgi:hypothetical protein
MALLIVFWIAAELLFPFVRDPIADTYRGDVFVVTSKNGQQVVTPLQAKLKLDVVDKGYIFDRRPGVTSDGVRLEFSGGDLDILARYGIPTQMINPNGEFRPFAQAFCATKPAVVEKFAPFFAGSKAGYEGYLTNYANAFHLTFMNMPGDMNCGSGHLGIIDFDNVQFALDKTSPHGYIVANLTRDSHISFVQRMIMKLRFDRQTMKTTFGNAL